MKCPNPKCDNSLMLKANLAEGCWGCPSCKGRFFIIITTQPKIETRKEVKDENDQV